MSSNCTAINSLIKDTNRLFVANNEENHLFGFFIEGNEIVPLYDPKGLRNNFLDGKAKFVWKAGDFYFPII